MQKRDKKVRDLEESIHLGINPLKTRMFSFRT